MYRQWLYCLTGMSALLALPSYASSMDKSVGFEVNYNIANDACEDNNLHCEDQSLGGAFYFRHNVYQPYFYQLSLEYLGKYDATYPALADPSKEADYDGNIWAFGISAGRVFSLTETQSIVGQIGFLPWYIDVEGQELDGSVDNDNKGISPFASLAYQYNLTKKSYLELGYQYTHGVGSDSTGGADIHQAFFSFGYRFGSTEPEKIIETVTETKVVTVTEKSMTLNLGENNSTVLFAFDSAKLNSNIPALVTPMETRLKENEQATLIIESHTDNVGAESYNQQLSQRRGDALKSYFVDKGISADRITVKAYGESKPLVPNDSAENRATNRRVVLFSPPFEKQKTESQNVESSEQGANL